MGITLNQLLNDLDGTCRLLEQQLFGVQVDSARRQSSGAKSCAKSGAGNSAKPATR